MLGRRYLKLGLWVLLVSQARCELPEQVKLSVHSFPPSNVFLETASGLEFLGKSGQPLTVRPPAMLDAALRPAQYANGFLLLKAENHGDLRVSVPAPEWSSGRLPQAGSYTLTSTSWLVSLGDYLTVYPLPCGLGLAVLLLGLWKARHWRRQNLQLNAQLNTTGDPLIGKRLGAYQVLSRLGQGGMAAVYKVRHPDGGLYAAKVIYFQQGDSQELLRFRREFKVLTRLNHPALLRAFDYGEEAGRAFAISELLDGQTLDHYVRPGGLEWSAIWPWVRTLLEGLACAHKAGVVHRDLKPANIMVCSQGIKILDFGLARQTQLTAVTLTGQAFGTPTYMAPEQVSASGSEVDLRTDLYSLGVMLYELLSGAPPFSSEDVHEIITMHVTQPPPPLASRVAHLPRGLAAVVHSLLAKKPANRYASAERVLEELAQIESQPGSTPEPAAEAEPGPATLPVPRRPDQAQGLP